MSRKQMNKKQIAKMMEKEISLQKRAEARKNVTPIYMEREGGATPTGTTTVALKVIQDISAVEKGIPMTTSELAMRTAVAAVPRDVSNGAKLAVSAAVGAAAGHILVDSLTGGLAAGVGVGAGIVALSNDPNLGTQWALKVRSWFGLDKKVVTPKRVLA